MDILVYLDFDGVLVTAMDRKPLADRDFLSADRVALVRAFLRQTGAKVVVTTTWRRNATCRDALIRAGLADDDFFHDWRTAIDLDLTNCGVSVRGTEIADHVARNGISNYVIFDDFPVLASQADYHVQPDDRIGLTPQHIVQALDIVTRQSPVRRPAAA